MNYKYFYLLQESSNLRLLGVGVADESEQNQVHGGSQGGILVYGAHLTHDTPRGKCGY